MGKYGQPFAGVLLKKSSGSLVKYVWSRVFLLLFFLFFLMKEIEECLNGNENDPVKREIWI